MSSSLAVAVGFVAGGVLGGLYFGWLWSTVRGLGRRGRSAPWFAMHAVARLVVALGVLTLIAHEGGWQALVAALAGFVTARLALLRRLGGRRRGAQEERT